MTVEDALRGALEYEIRVRDLYREAARGTREEESRALYEILDKDEQSHVDYLNNALRKLSEEGTIDAAGLKTALPSLARIQEAVQQAGRSLREAAAGRDQGGEVNSLQRALAAEEETSAYYRELASVLPDDARKVFDRFVEIEEGHALMVRAQLDLLTRTGYWFDVREFDQED